MKNLKGMTFGRLFILDKAISRKSGNDNRSRVFWICRCKCGNIKEIESSPLLTGRTNSCGCIRKEIIGKLNYKHGESSRNKTKEYRAWVHMKGRCYDLLNPKYKNYGGRGITVCDRWIGSFENFLEDMGRSPLKYSIHRVNNDKNYYPENCKWATDVEQANEKTTNVFIEFKNKRMTMKQWADELGYKYKYFHAQFRYKNKTMEELSYGRF